jgi:ribosomal protein L32
LLLCRRWSKGSSLVVRMYTLGAEEVQVNTECANQKQNKSKTKKKKKKAWCTFAATRFGLSFAEVDLSECSTDGEFASLHLLLCTAFFGVCGPREVLLFACSWGQMSNTKQLEQKSFQSVCGYHGDITPLAPELWVTSPLSRRRRHSGIARARTQRTHKHVSVFLCSEGVICAGTKSHKTDLLVKTK